jgi:nitrite reductase/ring-hydroxylating ferredoxin subunit
MNSTWLEWPVARFSDLGERGAKGFLAGDGDWPFRGFVVRQGTDIFAYANVCPHQRHALDLIPDDFLVQNGNMIRCASHGALFLPTTGDCVFGPCAGKRLIRLDCRVDDGLVIVIAPDSLRSLADI